MGLLFPIVFLYKKRDETNEFAPPLALAQIYVRHERFYN